MCVPENIHTNTTEGHRKFQGGGGLKRPEFFKGKYKPKLEFPEEWAAQTKKTFRWGGGGEYGYFLKQHNVLFIL